MLHKKLLKNRDAAFIVASKSQYSRFLEFTMSGIAHARNSSVWPLYTTLNAFLKIFYATLGYRFQFSRKGS